FPEKTGERVEVCVVDIFSRQGQKMVLAPLEFFCERLAYVARGAQQDDERKYFRRRRFRSGGFHSAISSDSIGQPLRFADYVFKVGAVLAVGQTGRQRLEV